jgi:hypothetical protein
MTDVRLTATNPEDSSVVPVACNEKGELKLEEPIDNSFDGNLDGDLSVTGSAEFALDVAAGGAIDASIPANGGCKLFSTGTIIANRTGSLTPSSYADCFVGRYNGTNVINLKADGSAEFAGGKAQILNSGAVRIIRSDGATAFSAKETLGGNTNVVIGCDGEMLINDSLKIGNSVAQVASRTPNISLNEDGTSTFAGGKAGFTAEGYLWCTTRRGDIVILDATSNGLATWADYTPPTRKEQAKERIEDVLEVLKEEPQVSQQLPETEADTP